MKMIDKINIMFPIVEFIAELKDKHNGKETSQSEGCPDLESALCLAKEFISGGRDTYDTHNKWLTALKIKSGITVMRFVPAEICEKTPENGILTISIAAHTIYKDTELLKVPISCFSDIESIVNDEDSDGENHTFELSIEKLKSSWEIYEQELEWAKAAQKDEKQYDYDYAQLSNDVNDLYDRLNDDETAIKDVGNKERKLDLYKDVILYKYMLLHGWHCDERERWIKN